jgi:hypothetical protein
MKIKKLFILFLVGVAFISFTWAQENQTSPLSAEMLKSEVIKGYGALGLKITNYTGNAYTVLVCDRPSHICEKVHLSVSAQNHNTQSAQLIGKIRYLNAQGQGPWINYGSTMVPGVLNDNYVNVPTGPAIGVGPSGVGATGASCAQIKYELKRGSEIRYLSFQINKLPRGTYGNKTYSGSYTHKTLLAKNFEDQVGPGHLPYCGYRTGATADPSNCTLNWQDNVSSDESDARRKISMRTKGGNKTGTIFWKITTHEFIGP